MRSPSGHWNIREGGAQTFEQEQHWSSSSSSLSSALAGGAGEIVAFDVLERDDRSCEGAASLSSSSSSLAIS